jgi:uncharacterized membrane-anchored protein
MIQASTPNPINLSPRAIAPWRFWLAIGFQGILIAGLALPSLFIYLNGTSVILQTIPVDPYDWLRGYSQSLRYDISNLEYLRQLPGGGFLSDAKLPPQTVFYLILQAPAHAIVQSSPPPAPWRAIAVRRDRPPNLSAQQVLLQGKIVGDRTIQYGLESYYFPEDQQVSMNQQIRAVTGATGSLRQLRVEARVDSSGRAIPVSLWIGDRNYKF